MAAALGNSSSKSILFVAYARSRQHRWTYIASSKLWSLEKNIPKTKMAARSSSYKQTV